MVFIAGVTERLGLNGVSNVSVLQSIVVELSRGGDRFEVEIKFHNISFGFPIFKIDIKSDKARGAFVLCRCTQFNKTTY